MILFWVGARRARGAHPENRPLRLCQVQYGKFHKHEQGVRRSVCEDANPSGRGGGPRQTAARVDSGPRALPATETHTGAPGQAEDRAPDLPESPVDAKARSVTTVFPTVHLRRSLPVPDACFVWTSFTRRK